MCEVQAVSFNNQNNMIKGLKAQAIRAQKRYGQK